MVLDEHELLRKAGGFAGEFSGRPVTLDEAESAYIHTVKISDGKILASYEPLEVNGAQKEVPVLYAGLVVECVEGPRPRTY
tara:strand:- start:10423 stop:10665 length:243 start_codon:yes stop_codon:yes gene_type:complete